MGSNSPDDGHPHRHEPRPDIGQRLREARQSAGLSQEAVSERTGYAARSLARWESGDCDPGFCAIVELASVYDVSLDWLGCRSELHKRVQPGQVMVDEDALQLINDLVSTRRCLRDVPPRLIRHPGIDYAFVVPRHIVVMGMEAARLVDARMQTMVKQLRANG